jgi:hypothetical protein
MCTKKGAFVEGSVVEVRMDLVTMIAVVVTPDTQAERKARSAAFDQQ